jgi:hypothetical protein
MTIEHAAPTLRNESAIISILRSVCWRAFAASGFSDAMVRLFGTGYLFLGFLG